MIVEDTVWTKETANLIFNRPVIIFNGATLSIEEGTTVKFEKSSNDLHIPSGIFVYDGALKAEGSQKNPIIFTSDQEASGFRLEFGSIGEQESFLRYIKISKGGYKGEPVYQSFYENYKKQEFLIQKAYAEDDSDSDAIYPEESPVVLVRAGKVHIENSVFENNLSTDVLIEDGIAYDENGEVLATYKPKIEIINSNFLDEKAIDSKIECLSINEEGEEVFSQSCSERVLLKDNWYNNPLGPTETSLGIKGSEISGYYNLNSFRENDLIVDPAIVIPGIMGSALDTLSGMQLELDPILHTYDNLIFSFEENGYEKDKNLFEFPYEWRDSNILTADLLKEKISQITEESKISKVDLVAHSMGGLVSRYYIESPGFKNNVDQLITLGTPHHGAPEAYLIWEAGEGFDGLFDMIAKDFFRLEAFHSGFLSLKEYIQTRISSVEQLLPDYDYLYDVSDKEMREYSDGYPQNNFLDFLNNESKIENLKKVDFYNIYGKVSEENTISGFRVVDSSDSDDWEHGMPENFYNTNTDQGIEYGEGDKTVPLRSSNVDFSDKSEEIDSVHGSLPTEAQCLVIKELTGKAECNYISTFDRIKNILTFGVFSPIDIQVIAPDGKKVGKNFETGEIYNEISGAYYSGYDGIENEILTIPNPVSGEYKVLTQGTGEGDYKIEISNILESDGGEVNESSVEISGVAIEDQEEEKKIEIENGKIELALEIIDEDPPTISAYISPEPNENGWWNEDVTVHFEAEDESGIKDITPDIVLTEEGKNQSVVGEAEDNYGNVASIMVSGINIDKTKPIINLISPENKEYKNDNVAKIKYESNEEVSLNIYLDGEIFYENQIDLSLLSLGEHQLSIVAEDLAGNESEDVVINFKIKTDIDSIISNIKHYFDLGLIKKRITKRYLEIKLKNLKRSTEILNFVENRSLPRRFKGRIINNLERRINHEIQNIVRKVERSRDIDEKIKNLLVEDLESIKV